MYQVLIRLFFVLVKCIQTICKSKEELIIENLALRQQVTAYHAKKTKPTISNLDRIFWISLRQTYDKWKDSLIIVKPETVISWQRRRFKRHWTRISKIKKPGRKRVNKEIRELIYRMAEENSWGAPRIYSELLMLGYTDVSESSVSRYLKRYRAKHPDKLKQQSWRSFLRNHANDISAMDFFIVPTVNFNLLSVFFVIDHGRRRLLHLNVTNQPFAKWVIQQLRDAFPYDQISKYIIMDRDKIFSKRVKEILKWQLGVKPKITSYKSPWQNGIAERFILSVRNDLLNQMIIFNEDHLRRLMREYIDYYNKDRCHLSLDRDSPLGRHIQNKPSRHAEVISISKLGGLQHRYDWKKVA